MKTDQRHEKLYKADKAAHDAGKCNPYCMICQKLTVTEQKTKLGEGSTPGPLPEGMS